MNIAFISTGEFEPFFYDCMARPLEHDGIKAFYVGFFLDTRVAIKKINRPVYPERIIRNKYIDSKPTGSSFSKEELYEITEYDYLQLRSNGVKIKRERLINKALYYERFFYDFFKKHNINAIITWNSFPLMVHVAWKAARKMGIKQVFFENGQLPDTLMIDTEGVNFQSSLVDKKRDFYEKVEVAHEEWLSFTEEYKKGKKITPEKNKGIMSYWKKFYYALLMRNWFYRDFYPDLTDDRLRQSIYKKLCVNFLTKEKKLDLPKDFIFLPFQYPYDTQVLINSPYIKDMSSFVKTCYPAIKHALGTRYRIVVKEHPDDIGRTDYSQLRKEYPDILWIKKYDIEELIEKSKLVITINSSVGVKTLMHHKPLITLGNSFYNIDGVTYHVKDPDKLGETIKIALQKGADTTLIDKFLYYLRFKYLAEGSPRRCNEESLFQAYKKIKTMLMEN
jgi:capsular polysaccharide export protein